MSNVYPDILYVQNTDSFYSKEHADFDARAAYSDLEEGDEVAVYELVKIQKVKVTTSKELVDVELP